MKKLLFPLLLLIIALPACKKENTDPDFAANCKLSSVTFDDSDKYNITYNGSVITDFVQVSGSSLQKESLFYNSDSLLTHRYTYDKVTNKLTDVDTFVYDVTKKITAHLWFSVNSSGVRSFERKETFSYNSSNQIISSKDSSFEVISNVTLISFEYSGNRLTKETRMSYSDGDYTGKDEYTFTYSTKANNIYTILKQPTLVLNDHPLYIAEFTNMDALISQSVEKSYDETNTLVDTFTRVFTYTFDNGKVASVSDNDSGIFIRFTYACE